MPRTSAARLLLLLLAAQPLEAATLFDPALRFRSITTDHFVIHFHQGEQHLAARLASIAEDAWVAVSRALGQDAPPRTEVVLVDQSDESNGWATPLPYDTIVVTAAWPAGSTFIGNTDDWLRLVFTHEFVHIAHLDRSASWARLLRGVFGRVPLAFPNLFLPAWQVEGLAAFHEGRLTGSGRLHAPDFRAMTREAARAGRLQPLDRVNGGLTSWPGGLAPYAYGLDFHAYLADRFGEPSLAAIADATAGAVPFTGSLAFRKVFGQSLGALWDDYQQTMVDAVPAEAPIAATRLTEHGFTALGPRFAPPSCDGCAPEIVYSLRSPHRFPSLEALSLDGRTSKTLTTRYLGATVGVNRDRLVFDQQERRRNAGLYSDLFLLDRASGNVRALTHEARLADPDLSPDGATIVAVREDRGSRALVLVGLTSDGAEAPVTLVSEAGTQFNAPRWSPDGRSVAAERHRRGAFPEIVVVGVETGAVRVLASRPSGRIVTPAWRPDGLAVVAAAALDDRPFNLFEIDVDGGGMTQLTALPGGATWPDISGDGRTIVFVGQTADGFDIFSMPYPRDAGAARPFRIPDTDEPERAAPPVSQTSAVVPAPYSPWKTLRPTFWSPVVETADDQVRIGATTAGYDVLQYHAYAASATWRVREPADVVAPGAAVPDWEVAYAYRRWRPTWFASASADTGFVLLPSANDEAPAVAAVRERQVEAGVLFPIQHVRVTHQAFGTLLRSTDRYTLADRDARFSRTAMRAGWSSSSVQTYGYSISPEDGMRIGVTGEAIRRAWGSDGDATTFTADLRAYLPGLRRHHVVAVRAGGGVSTGDGGVRRTFHLGGSPADDATGDFDREAFSLLRGFGTRAFAGSRVAVLNAEYRWPLARPERGVGTWPLFLHSVHAAIFADAGHAWTRAFHAGDVKAAAGAELSLDLIAGYTLPLTTTIGVGWGRDGATGRPTGAAWYARVGRAF